MRLHKITTLNLNSLYGAQSLDLDAELKGAPLFLIHGKTGAGKSTLMDAVALALFGRTPRLDPRAGDPDSEPCAVMSRGTGECSAQVEFSKWGEKGERLYFRAIWTVRRAHRRADGKLQAVERSLEQRMSGGSWKTLVSGRKKEDSKGAFDEVLEGFTAEDFQRSMLLAQGKFDELLNATETERAGLLERLTDTRSYADIGAQAAEMASVHRKTLAFFERQRLSLLLPTSEEIELARDGLKGTEATKAEAAEAERAGQLRLDWFRRHEALRAELAELEVAGTDLARRELAFAEEGEKLAEHERCEAVFPLLKLREESLDELKKTRHELASLNALRQSTESGVVRLRERTGSASVAMEAQEEFLSSLRGPCAELESTATAAKLERGQRDELLVKREQAAREVEALKRNCLRIESEESAHRGQLQELELWMDSNAQLGVLEEKWRTGLRPECAELLSELTHLERKDQNLRDQFSRCQLEQTQAQVQSARLILDEEEQLKEPKARQAVAAHALKTLSENVGHADYRRELERQIERANGLCLAAVKVRELAAQLGNARELRAQLEDKLEQTRRDEAATALTLLECERARERCQIEQDRAQRAASRLALVAELAERRQALADGEECPLCGSQTHPFCQTGWSSGQRDLVSQHLFESQQETNVAVRALDQAVMQVQQIQSQCCVLLERRSSQLEQLAGCNTKVEQLEGTLRREVLFAELSPAIGDGAKIETTALALRELVPRFEQREQELVRLRARRDQLEFVQREFDEADRELESLRTAHRQTRDRLILRSGVLRAELEALNTSELQQAEQLRAAATHREKVQNQLRPFESLWVDGTATHIETGGTVGFWRAELKSWIDRVEATLARYADHRNRRDQLFGIQQAAQLQKVNAERELAQLLIREQEILVELEGREQAFRALQKQAQSLWQLILDLFTLRATPSDDTEKIASPANSQELVLAVEQERLRRVGLLGNLRLQLEKGELELAQLEGKLSALAESVLKAEIQADKAERELIEGLRGLGGLSAQELREKQLPRIRLDALREQRRNLMEQRQSYAVRLEERELAVVQHARSMPSGTALVDGWTLEMLTNSLRELKLAALARDREYDEAKDAASQIERRLQEAKDLSEKWGHAQREADVWLRLNDLIGTGKGDAFRKFAQSLNLHRLISRANGHLSRLSERYQLVQSRRDGVPTLEFSIQDMWSVGEPRSTRSLSGGERFLVSLALALGLSDLRSHRLPIETLLLDEGFGTLDAETLELALGALVRLQGDGRTVGVISHVAALKERILAQVHVKEVSPGRSVISVPKVS